MEAKIKESLATIILVSPDSIKEDTAPANFSNWDSMRHMFLVASFEERFNNGERLSVSLIYGLTLNFN